MALKYKMTKRKNDKNKINNWAWEKELLYTIKAHIYVIVQLPFKIFYFVFYTISLHLKEVSTLL